MSPGRGSHVADRKQDLSMLKFIFPWETSIEAALLCGGARVKAKKGALVLLLVACLAMSSTSVAQDVQRHLVNDGVKLTVNFTSVEFDIESIEQKNSVENGEPSSFIKFRSSDGIPGILQFSKNPELRNKNMTEVLLSQAASIAHQDEVPLCEVTFDGKSIPVAKLIKKQGLVYATMVRIGESDTILTVMASHVVFASIMNNIVIVSMAEDSWPN